MSAARDEIESVTDLLDALLDSTAVDVIGMRRRTLTRWRAQLGRAATDVEGHAASDSLTLRQQVASLEAALAQRTAGLQEAQQQLAAVADHQCVEGAEPGPLWIATLSGMKYDLTGVGATERQAWRVLEVAARQYLRSGGSGGEELRPDWREWYGCWAQRVEAGHAYLDGGKAGEQPLKAPRR